MRFPNYYRGTCYGLQINTGAAVSDFFEWRLNGIDWGMALHYLEVQAVATAAALRLIGLFKRSTEPSGGGTTGGNHGIMPLRSNMLALPAAIVRNGYLVSPTTPGTLVDEIAVRRIVLGATGTGVEPPPVVFNFREKPQYLDADDQSLVLNAFGITGDAGNAFNLNYEISIFRIN